MRQLNVHRRMLSQVSFQYCHNEQTIYMQFIDKNMLLQVSYFSNINYVPLLLQPYDRKLLKDNRRLSVVFNRNQHNPIIFYIHRKIIVSKNITLVGNPISQKGSNNYHKI